MKKLVFLDVDGTLMDFKRQIPESTKEAVRLARARGHRLFICTGRIAPNISRELLNLGFDGFVAAAGAYVQIGEQVIHHQTLDSDKLASLTRILREHHAKFYFQGADGIYISPLEFEDWKQCRMAAMGWIPDEFLKLFHVVDRPEGQGRLTNGDYMQADISVDELTAIVDKKLDGYFSVTGASFGKDQIYCGEITRKGITKGTGMEAVVCYYGMKREDTIAVGDGPNDFDMLHYAHVGIAMGNGVEALKKEADYVTDTVECDGIWKAFEKYQLI